MWLGRRLCKRWNPDSFAAQQKCLEGPPKRLEIFSPGLSKHAADECAGGNGCGKNERSMCTRNVTLRSWTSVLPPTSTRQTLSRPACFADFYRRTWRAEYLRIREGTKANTCMESILSASQASFGDVIERHSYVVIIEYQTNGRMLRQPGAHFQ